MIKMVIGATHEMKGEPAQGIQKKAQVETRRNRERIFINNCSEVIKTNPC
jgi:hypothetical protein